MRKTVVITQIFLQTIFVLAQEKTLTEYVNPFIGTSNFGTTNPGAIAPRGMVSVTPFNTAGKVNGELEKDSRWLSTPYVAENTFLTGFSHVNLSGVGCPELGVILAMPTTGELETDYLKYGSTYSNEKAHPSYYSVELDKHKVRVEATATTRTGVSKYHFPAGQANVLINLGLGLTNEEGALVKIVSDTEIEGIRNVGTFCYYKPEESYPVYFVARFNKPAKRTGIWKRPKKYEGVEAQWMGYNSKERRYEGYRKEIIGDSIGTYFSYDFDEPTTVEMKIGISYVSIENARGNLERETSTASFDQIRKTNDQEWNRLLGKIQVEGGSEEDKTIFYTALYHTLIHPNTLNDGNGEYPSMAQRKTMKTDGTRYTTFSFWDTYRNLHSLMSLVYPEQQSNMVKSMLDIYKESGWLPKWELNATETTTMVGDPAGIVLTDTYLRGITDFDAELAYEAMLKSAETIEDNPLRPGIQDYLSKGYLTTKTTNSGSVSTTQEYNITDYAIAQMAKELGKKDDFKRYNKRSVSYRKLFDPKLNLLRPKNDDGSWNEPFDPGFGNDFVKNLGFIEGNSWQYTFMVSHDAKQLIKMMGGGKAYVNQLNQVFEKDQFDMANEPDIAYPYLYNFVKGNEWRTQEKVKELVRKYFMNAPAGLPGNDDTGTMSAWLIYSMMGIYPVVPADPSYTLSTPFFDKITIQLNPNYYQAKTLVIEKKGEGKHIKNIKVGGKPQKGFFVDHAEITETGHLEIIMD
jgi:predicted alpha-1,2-mannosidase